MANIKSAAKQHRQSLRRAERNRAQKSTLRTAVKKLQAAIEGKQAAAARGLLVPAVRLLDRAGQRGLVKRRAASRVISRLTVAVNGLGG